MNTDPTDATVEANAAGYLRKWEVISNPTGTPVVLTGWERTGLVGVHREDCSYFPNGTGRFVKYPATIAYILFLGERLRNDQGTPRAVYFCPRCMVRPRSLAAQAVDPIPAGHEMTWEDERSFNWRLTCACGWKSGIHLMERDAVSEARKHLAEVQS